MHRHSEAEKVDVRRRMGPPHRQIVAQISAELGIHVINRLQVAQGLAAGRGSGAGIAQGPRGLERCRQIHGCTGDRRIERHRAQLLLPRAGPLPGAGGALASGIAGCQREAGADAERTEGAGEAPRPGPAGDQAAREGAAQEGEGPGGSGGAAAGHNKDAGPLGRGRGGSNR
jgi:hypothetical protein